jgi:hypothetical protein
MGVSLQRITVVEDVILACTDEYGRCKLTRGMEFLRTEKRTVTKVVKVHTVEMTTSTASTVGYNYTFDATGTRITVA